MKKFEKSFTQQEPIPDAGIERAVEVMRSGRLHRYNALAGEPGEVDLLEGEFARYQGSRYCLACTSGGYALQVALRSLGVGAGDKVLCNGWTLAPVPGAIFATGADIVLVETTEDCILDLEDLDAKAASGGARFLLLSHMRGHLADMDRLIDLCSRRGVEVIEDCAHTMGARWNGRLSGSFGRVACFSTQTYKHMNSGEGGFLVTDDKSVMARAVVHSGSYMLYERHVAAPAADAYEEIRYQTPNLSGRMDNLRAAILRPQLEDLDRQCERWNRLYGVIEDELRGVAGIRLPHRPAEEAYVGSSIQFSLPGLTGDQIQRVVADCELRGVQLKWFGEQIPRGYTSRYDSWRYLGRVNPLPGTLDVLATLLDMRVPLTFDEADCRLIAAIIVEVVTGVTEASTAPA